MTTGRVLVVRCCRTSRLIDAMAFARRRHPSASIAVLCAASTAREVTMCGADEVIPYRGGRLGLFRLFSALARHLLFRRYEAVVLPFMIPDDTLHANVLRLACALRAPEIVILRGEVADVCGRSRLLALAFSSTVRSAGRLFDVPLLLLGLSLACLRRRHRGPVRPAGPQRVLHIISGLGAGGAQRQLAALLARTPADRYQAEVLVLARYEGEFSRGLFAEPQPTIRYVDPWPAMASSLWHIFRLCRRERYDIVHTWLFSANVVGVAAARLAGTPRVIASVRNLSLWKREWYHRPWFRFADALASRAADVVTVNAHALVEDHARWAAYPADRIEVVPNGLDPAPGSESAGARAGVRAEFSFDANALVVGTVGRLAPEKDQATFLRILARLRWALPRVRGLIIGGGDAEPGLRTLARHLGLETTVVFTGERADARRLIAGFDLMMLTSRCEGLPNVLLEAILLGVPCISTDVGGAGDVLGTRTVLFEAGDDWAGFVKARLCLDSPHAAAGRAARARRYALEHFSEARMAESWLALYGSPAEDAAPAAEQERAVA